MPSIKLDTFNGEKVHIITFVVKIEAVNIAAVGLKRPVRSY